MKKDIEWLRDEVNKLPLKFFGFSVLKQREEFAVNKNDVLELIDQLDEPEVLSQELPVVPTWFDEWWKDITKGGGRLFHNIERFYEELFSSGTSEMYRYIGSPDNKKKLLNIIINELEYVVEEEQKYYILGKQDTPILFRDYKSRITETSNLSDAYPKADSAKFEFTEQEIKDYDERYWAFAVKVEELEE